MRLVLTYAKNNIEATLQMYDGAYVLAYYDDFTVRPVHGTYHQRFPPAFVVRVVYTHVVCMGCTYDIDNIRVLIIISITFCLTNS